MFQRFAPAALAILRILAGVMFAMHGAQKLLKWPPQGAPPRLPPLLVAAGVIELTCGVLMAIGLFAAVAAFVACGEMAVAYFMVHAPQGFLPILNKGEMTVLYCFFFLFLAAHGPGPASLDALRRRPGRLP